MARPHKQMPGMTYHIVYHADRSSTVTCTYLCPYCKQDTSASFEAQQMLQINSNREDSLRLCIVVCVEKLPM